jgi:hypothetical protein
LLALCFLIVTFDLLAGFRISGFIGDVFKNITLLACATVITVLALLFGIRLIDVKHPTACASNFQHYKRITVDFCRLMINLDHELNKET